MSSIDRERALIEQSSNGPLTVETLTADLVALGVERGMTLIVHSSMRSLGGWVCGGPAAVILALEEALGTEGTLVMPTHSGHLSDPTYWENPPVPPEWWETIKRTMPAYRPDLTQTRFMGILSESFRKQDGVRRSNHPWVSFAAWGRYAEVVTAYHTLAFGLGEGSPLARIYDLDGWILLLGVGHANSTSLHLAELRADYPGKEPVTGGAPVFVDGWRQWVEFLDLEGNSEDFPQIGADYARDGGLVRQGKVGAADCLLLPQRPLVDYAVRWLENARR